MKPGSFKDIGLWYLDLEGLVTAPEAWLKLLSTEEIARYRRFYQAKDRLSYAAAHALVRHCLAETLDKRPESLSFRSDGQGRPLLGEAPPQELDFNLSHTDGMAALVLSRRGRAGVDVENIERRAGQFAEASAYGMNEEESRWLETSDEAERQLRFFTLWTAREAVAKADGRGLGLALGDIRIDRSNHSAQVSDQAPGGQKQWRLWHFRPTPRHLVTVAGELGCDLQVMRPQLQNS